MCCALRIGTFDLKIQQGFPTITQVTPTAIPGAFEIDTGSDFTVPNSTYLVGLAKVNHRGQVAPVASVCRLIVFMRFHGVARNWLTQTPLQLVRRK